MKVLIVAPRYKPFGQFYELPLGLAYLSAYLKTKGVHVDFLNLNQCPFDEVLIKMLSEADIVCTGGLSVHYHQVKTIIDMAKCINPAIKTIVGGGLISATAGIVMRALNADVGIIGEGEITLFEVIKAIEEKRKISTIPNVIANEDGVYVIDTTSYRTEIDNIDTLPFPDYEGLGIEQYLDKQLCGDEHYLYPFDNPRGMPIISSRSCPFNCTFCFHPIGQKYRQRSLDNLFTEIDYLVERYRINILSILDELFSLDHARIKEFCRRIKKYNLRWMTQMRVDSVTEEIIGLLKESGCFQISFGVESASNKVLESMNKKISIEQIGQALEWSYNAGIGIQGNFIFGDKAETPATAKETLDWWLAHKKYALNLTYIIPYPGSGLYNYAVIKGIIKDETKYLTNNCPFVKITPSFPEVSSMLESYRNQHNHLPAINQVSQKVGYDPIRGELYQVTAVCPHCKKQETYKNLYWGSTGISFLSGRGYRIGCRDCNQRFDLTKFN
ncbi:MAG: radical SAM protein [Candidatus Omnitrophota bacterium]